MRLRGSNMLGLAMDDRGVRCAEVVGQGTRRLVRRLAHFSFPADATPATPAACGTALKAFLVEHDFDARDAVIGVPARWLISQDRELPPTDRAAAIDLLRLHGERMAAGGGSDLVVDVSGDVTPNTASRMLLVGILRPQLDKLRAISEAAGINLAAVTSTSLAVHAAIGAAARGEGLILIGDGASELVGAGPTAARLLRHAPAVVGTTPTSVAQLGSDLRRAITLSGLNPAGADAKGSIAVWNGVGLSDDVLRELSNKAGAPLNAAAVNTRAVGVEVSPLALNGEATQATPESFLPAIALASGRDLPVDFLDPRLAPPKQKRFGRKAVYGAVAALLVVGGLIGLYQLILSTERHADQLESQVSDRAPAATAAKAETTRLEYGRSYFESRPPVLQGLREISLAFNYGEPIWVTSFQLKDNGRGVLQGKSTDQRLVLQLRDRLAANPNLKPVTVQNLQQATGTSGRVSSSGEQSFTINFTYIGH